MTELLNRRFEIPFPKASRAVGSFIKHYLYGAFAKSWNGGVAAVYGYIGSAVGSAVDPQVIQTPSLKLAWYCFASAWVVSMMGYFKDNPIPERLPGTNPPIPLTKS